MRLIESSGIDDASLTVANQAKWIEKISAWAEEETNSYQLPEVAGKILSAFLRRSHESRGKPREHPLFRGDRNNCFAEPLSIRDLVVITRALAEIRETVAREKTPPWRIGF